MYKPKDYFASIHTFSDYPSGKTDFIYDFVHLPQLEDIFRPFHLSEIAGEGDTFSKVCRIMQWVDDNTSYDGASPLGTALPNVIIDFGLHQKNPINCSNRAILFCDALVSLDIFAYPIILQHRPYLKKKKAFAGTCRCHVIAQVWLPEKQCWAAFDPSFNTYFTDRHGNCVSVTEMVKIERTLHKVRSIDNKTTRRTKNGSLLTRSSLLDICVFPGNDFKHRYHFDKELHLVPDSYIETLKNIVDPDIDWTGWDNNMINAPKMKITDLEGRPKWNN